jgi:hypothetical protein
MGYRLLCDENVHPETVEHLEADGHDAVHVREVLSPGVDFPDNRTGAYELASMVDRLAGLISDPGRLPGTVFLTEDA